MDETCFSVQTKEHFLLDFVIYFLCGNNIILHHKNSKQVVTANGIKCKFQYSNSVYFFDAHIGVKYTKQFVLFCKRKL